ncbi:MAG: hypothetical protein CGU29_11055 [Candidatus Dactylopiibacterium carminicum]|uniref:Pectate lyase n=1 Tax=Candidatus Dactylopiibacterium carminicum TaxID=857335 RepID=A0A272ER22_9RHOO|nr:pectate lyase [Candidatus Dactylopiibacterium carminicum]KAF7598658.1 hypothetical protein BGI27_11975 [Candidatus Dactylopiibacterium carminicum]PAS92548.1 MAG: hypothetical protein CGU29_11055 [Candidatus Dactylopiibacterium carminicum]PAS98526.1 MAG: hypothetical protein BSR46_11990 [Candidatus Dactylopiibacterium carminicum]
MIRKILGGIVAMLLASGVHAATDYPSGYTKCVKEGSTCPMSGTRSVAFGKSGTFVYATLTGSFVCQASLFPSNSITGSRWCSYAGSATSSSSSSSSSSSGSGSGGITGATCTSTGSVSISSTVVVESGETYDGGCKTFNPTSALGNGSQSESQKPAFRINGGTLKNAILGNNGVDGVHFYGGGTLQNFRWTNIGEDAFTVKSSGTVNISAVSGYDGEDKFGQVNAESTMNISNCVVDNVAKVIRQNGGTTYKITVNIDRCRLSNLKEGVFRTDSSKLVAKLTNSVLSNAGTVCIGSWASCTQSGNSGN